MPHDYVPNTDMYIHTHWSHIHSSLSGGGVTWAFEVSYSKGHNQAAFSAPITINAPQDASLIQYQHMIDEVQLSAAGGAGGLLVTENLEVDGIILVRAALAGNTLSPTNEPFLHFIDIHYQTTHLGTKQKAPDFWT